ncbi:zinc knuckle CX2CX4HX4C containing protein [Tanacetum coccineum]
MGASVDHLSARLKLEIDSSLAQRSSTRQQIRSFKSRYVSKQPVTVTHVTPDKHRQIQGSRNHTDLSEPFNKVMPDVQHGPSCPRSSKELCRQAVLEGGPWLIHNSLIILKKWSMDTRLLKEESTRILIWVKLHDVLIQVFEEDGISLIATFIGKPVMLDSYTSVVCNDSWARSSFARCLIKYEWRPPRCDICKIFGHVHDHYPKKVVSPPIITTSNVVTPTIEKTNDGFQMVGKKKKRKGESKSTNGVQFMGPLVKQYVKYEPKVTTSEPKKGATNVGNASKSSMLKSTGTSSENSNINTSNSYSALENEEEEDEEHVENVYDESANLFSNSKTGESSSFTAAAG